MDVIDLPVLPIDAPLKDALGVMRAAERSGIVAIEISAYFPESGRYRCWLYKAGWVVVGISRGEYVLGDLEQRRRVHILSDGVTSMRGIDLTNPQHTWQAVEQMLDKVGKSYALAGPAPPSGNSVRVITRHEELAAEVRSGPADCYCTNPNRLDDPHPYRPPPIPGNGQCLYDGSKIVCM